MRLPIPNDWDGETWESVCVQWPKSVYWHAILRGLISMPGAGRFWDERSGIITEAQKVGQQIWELNTFENCEGEIPEPEACSVRKIILSDDFMSEDTDMGVSKVYIDTETCELVVEYGGGCENECRFPLNCSTAPASDRPDDYTPPGGGTGGDEFSACGKAYAAVHAVMQLASSFWTHSNDITLFPFKAITEENPGIELDSYWKWIAKSLGLIGAVEPFSLEWTDQDDKEQTYLCYALPLFSDTPNNDLETDEAFSNFENVFMGQTAVDRLLNPWWGTFFRAIIWTIGKEQLGDIIVSNAGDTAENCDCPEQSPSEYPNGYGWVIDWNFKENGGAGWELDANVTQNANGFFVNDPGGQYNYVNGGAQFDPVDATSETRLKFAAFYFNAPQGWGGGTNPRPLKIASTPEQQLIPSTVWGENVSPGAQKKIWASVEGIELTPGIEMQVGIDGYNWYQGQAGGPMYIERIIIAGDGPIPLDLLG